MKNIIIDTNLLLDDPKIIYKLSKTHDKIIIPLTVLKELDKHKFNKDLSFSARAAIREIVEFRDLYPDKVVLSMNDCELDGPDLRIIESATANDAEIATKDISMTVIANAKGVETKLYSAVVNGLCNPYTYVDIKDVPANFFYPMLLIDEEYDEFLKWLNLAADHWFFVIIKDEDREVYLYANNPKKHEIHRLDNDSDYREIYIENTKLKAMDFYQICAFYAMKESDHCLITGKWGTGKSLLTTAHALSINQGKIFITRPPVGINSRYDIGFLPGPQPLYSKILTPYGWTTMGELKVGDLVIGDDGKPAKVTHILPQGIKDVYEIECTNGGKTRACGEHVWSVKNHNELKHNKPFKDRTTLEIKNTLFNTNSGCIYNYSLPNNQAVLFDSTEELLIPPYTLGVLLGDGSFSNSVSIINTDDDIIQRVKEEMSKIGVYLKKHNFQYTLSEVQKNNKPAKKVKLTNSIDGEEYIYNTVGEASTLLGINRSTIGSRCKSNTCVNNVKYEFIDNENRWTNSIKNEIYNLKLEGTKSDTKFIPDKYKYSSIENRVALLQGLMDTDGTIKNTTGEQSFTTTSKRLAEDIVELSRSLGSNATYYVRNRVGRVSKIKDRSITTRLVSYEVCLPKFDKIKPFYTKRKAERVTNDTRYNHYNKIKDVKLVSREEVQCIRIDNDSSLYITDDYIITHNSKEDKMEMWFAGILSSLYFLYANTRHQISGKDSSSLKYDLVKDKYFKEQFEMVPINAVQGMSLLEDDIMIIDECQLIDIDYLSMILSRANEGSKLILLGDLAQTYSVVRPSESGLLKLLRLLPNKSIAYVDLKQSYRSDLIELADLLQDKTIC